MHTYKATNFLLKPFEQMISEKLELESLRQENDVLKKLKAELAIKNRRDNYERDVTIRKQEKQIEKLLQEVNALKVVQGRASNKSVLAFSYQNRAIK